MAQRKYDNPATFDTLSYAKKLQSAGFSQVQAEVQAETFLSIVQEQLVSKRDIKELEKQMHADHEKTQLDIENVRKELKIDIENIRKDLSLEIKNLEIKTQTQIELLRRDLKIWFGGMLVVAVGVLSGMMTLIVHLSN